MTNTSNICVFDIDNIQDDYAYVLEFIECCENDNIENIEELIARLVWITKKITISGGVVDKGIAVRYYESLIQRKVLDSEGEVAFEKGIKKLTELKSSSINERGICYFTNHEMLYHIRIHLKSKRNCKLTEMQYLALLLQRLENLFVNKSDTKKRLSVFIVPEEGGECPYLGTKNINSMQEDNEIYNKVSHYLRLLSKEYGGIIYGAQKVGNNIRIVPIDYKIANRTDEIFPIVIVDKDNYKKLFEDKISADTIKELFLLKQNRRYRNAAAENPKMALCDYIAETAFRRLQKNLKDNDTILEEVNNTLCELQTINWIAFSIFCFLFTASSEENIKHDINYAVENALNLCMGIKQLAQNSIQYSEKHTCVFSFVLNEDSILEINIADLNYRSSMIESFVQNLEWEYENIDDTNRLSGHKKILETKETIALRNLFSDFQDEDNFEIWQDFRQQDISAHIGLLLFSIAAQRSNATINVRSSSSYGKNDSKSYYYKEFKAGEVSGETYHAYAIPGTQFTITIPLEPLQKIKVSGLGQLNVKNKIEENYESFARCIEFESKKINCIDLCNKEILYDINNYEVTDSKNKFRLVQRWKEIWELILRQSLMEKKDIYYVNVDELEQNVYFDNGDNIEVFIKGFLEVVPRLDDCQLTAIAFIGATRRFIEIFRDACIAFSLRKFQQGLQIYVSEKKCVDNLVLFGEDYFDVVKNAYIMSMEHGSKVVSAKEYIMAKSLYEKVGNAPNGKGDSRVSLIPFDVILSCNHNEEKNKIFDKRLQQLANNDIDGDNSGFLIRNTHMRLGSKVHIHSFYEMPFLFYRTSIANRIAFQILHDMAASREVDIENDKIIFYGYASYSKAILTSLTEILKAYRKKKGAIEADVSFAAYQHNLQSESEEIQMHYGFLDDFPAKLKNDKIESNKLIKVVQIVPISSTLTTFEKMWNRFEKSIKAGCEKNIQLASNYTVFWITNELNDDPSIPTEVEASYWSEVKLKEQCIITNFKDFIEKNVNSIHYFIRCPVKWEHPLKCKWCYPGQLIDEIPLVETDQTSTVPTQQIRKKQVKRQNSFICENQKQRIKKLRGCVSYGHFIREQNHFQYYIDTQAYFYKVKREVKEWLKECRDKDNEVKEFPMMYVIFSPEHNTNVGFAQYVNTYYFGGVAEIVSINEDKEFRSNFVCEHAALIETIEDLYRYIEVNSLDDMPIKFYYVDDTIISGETFQKANSFLRSLLPEKYKNKYGTNIISKCFLLMDRLSSETKRNYVRDVDKDFCSFLHIDISNMRTQGDSCVGCKLQQDAMRLFKRSSTRNIESYWAEKIKNYIPIRYDEREKIKKYQTDDAYQRLVISHLAQNVLFNDNNCYEIGNTYDAILVFAFRFVNKKKKIEGISFGYDNVMDEIKGIECLGKFLKIISRPFFSFDFKIKMQVLTLIIILTEVFLGNHEEVAKYKYDIENSHILKMFITEKQRIELTIELGQRICKEISIKKRLVFLQEVLLECMTDMKSTYLLRKCTIEGMYKFVADYSIDEQEAFWKTYTQNIHRIIDCSSDEMRSFNFEYLLLSGEEYGDFEKKAKEDFDSSKFLYQAVKGLEKPKKKDPFYIFCHEILFQNTRILFDGIEKDIDREQSTDTYYMEQWKGFRNLENLIQHGKYNNQLPLREEKALFEFLRNKSMGSHSDPRTLVKERYENLLKNILSMVTTKYNLKSDDTQIALLTWTKDGEEGERKATIGEMDILTEINVAYPENKFNVKDKIVKALNSNSKESVFSLEENGYVLVDENEFYFVIFFDNPEVDLNVEISRTLKPIAKVFMYLEINSKDGNGYYQLRFILRDILAYRNRIMRMLESDFAGDMFTKYAHTIGEKNIIAHEKAISHNNTLDNERVLGFLIKQNMLNKYDNLDSHQAIKWLLMRNYVNEQIAKLFNRSFQDEESVLQPSIPEAPILYIDDSAKEYNKVSFFNNKLSSFWNLDFVTDDRFKLLESIIIINYNGLKNIRFIEDVRGRGYNVEFMKCIFIDIIFSAINHEVNRHEFLLRIDFLLNYRNTFRNSGLLPEDSIVQTLQRKKYVIDFMIEKSVDEQFDYLVIRNPVYKMVNDWNYKNEVIRRRMDDPLDYPDGHLSLLTIKRYIEGLRDELVGKAEFKYYEDPNKQLWFQSKLPIIRKEEE